MNWCHKTRAVSDKISYKMAAVDSGSEKRKKKRKLRTRRQSPSHTYGEATYQVPNL